LLDSENPDASRRLFVFVAPQRRKCKLQASGAAVVAFHLKPARLQLHRLGGDAQRMRNLRRRK